MNDIMTFAYLDPGTGSMLLQAIVGGSAGLVVLVRHLWRTFRHTDASQKEAQTLVQPGIDS